MTDADLPFWERPEQVEKFAAREPDERLQDLLGEVDDRSALSVLDLGCAAGRNAVWLAAEGFDVWALDASSAMVEETRRRLTAVLDEEEARRRVLEGTMADLGAFADGSFDLVVALGVYHNAGSREEWDRALAETSRVLEPGGRLLVATFGPGTDLTGEGLEPLEGEGHLFRAGPDWTLYLVSAAELDREMSRHGLHPVVPTDTVEVKMDTGRRVTVNGMYRKESPEGRA